MEMFRQWLADSSQPAMMWLADNGIDFTGRLFAAAMIFIIGAICIRLLAGGLRKLVDRRIGDKELLERFFVSVGTKTAWAVLLTIVVSKLGVDVAPLIAGLGATGFILGFACQESLGSLAAGVMIALNQPFRIGDYVAVAGYEGTILHLDMMAVTLSTGDNRKVTIPNKQAWGSAIVNYSAMPIRRVEVVVGVAYSADLARACAVALETIASQPGVLGDPAPTAAVRALAESSVTLAFRAWVKNADFWPVSSALTQRIKEAYDLAGIVIPFPQVDVHMVAKD